MKSVWRALIWKEWHEHKWKLVALTAVLISPLILTLLSDEPNGLYSICTATIWFAVPILSLFVGASAAAGENSQRTLHFLQSLPEPMHNAATIRIISSVLTVCIPIILQLSFVYAVELIATLHAPNIKQGMVLDRIFFANDGSDWYFERFFLGLSAASSIVIWVAAVGVNRSDEVRAGALGILAIVVYSFILVVFAWKFIDFHVPKAAFPSWFKTLGAIGPCGPIVLTWMEHPGAPRLPDLTSSWRILLVSGLSHATLACWFIAKFGRVSSPLRPSERVAPTVANDWLAPPRGSKIRALIWKQLRESGPLALVAMCLIFAMSMIITLIEAVNETFLKNWFAFTFGTWVALGFFVAIVAGIGVFIEEVRPGIEDFWRSRPIHRDQWFYVKFGFGIGITILAMSIPLLVVFILAIREGYHSPMDPDFHAGIVILLQATVFAVASLAMLLVRQAIYSAVLAISVVAVLPFLMEYFGLEENGFGIYLLGITLLATLLAWLAVRYDWSLRR
jgi:ABC-type transport system involved in multi-copper enzyme maturation permease subunit